MPHDGHLGHDGEDACEYSELHSAFEAGLERLEFAGFSEEGHPLVVSDGCFVVLEHGPCVLDEVSDVLLDGSCDESDEET